MSSDLRPLLGDLPLPLSQLGRRALNARAGLERHNAAFYLAEGALKLAAALRVGRWLEAHCDATSPLARALESLALPSLGHWNGFLRDVSAGIAASDPSDPLALPTRAMTRTGEGWQAVDDFLDLLAAEDIVRPEVARQARKRGVLGFFDALVAYRNEVIGHGAQRPATFYQTAGEALLAASTTVLASDVLFCGMHLAVPRLELTDDGHGTALRWKELTGLAGLLAGDVEGPAVAGQLYFVGPMARVALHPLVVHREEASGLERFGFLNRAVQTRGQDARDSQVKRADYLDYLTGETLPDVDAREALTAVLSKLRGHTVDPEAVDDVARTLGVVGEARSSASLPWEGRVLGGRFRVLRPIGSGGMGTVYEAEHLELPRRVAIKVLRADLAANSEAVRRFRREAQEASATRHPGIVAVEDFGETDDGAVYLVMELLEGQGLDELIAGGPLPIERAIGFAVEALDALEVAHARGVIHRDIKPANLFLARQPDGSEKLKILDFGIAKAATDPGLTGDGALGTPAYMAPEQIEAAEVDARADLYGLGATLYHLLVGKGPLDAPTAQSAIAKLARGEVERDPRRLRPAVPPGLAAAVARALDPDPMQRFQTAAAMREALSNPSAPVEPVRPASIAASAPPRRAGSVALLAGALAIGMVAVVFGWPLFVGDAPPNAPLTAAQIHQAASGSVVLVHSDLGDGTGFLVHERGLIATMDYVAEGRVTEVRFRNGASYTEVQQVVVDAGVALLAVDLAHPASGLPPRLDALAFGDSGALTVGSPLVSLGHPLGGALTLREGTVTSLQPVAGRAWVGASMPIKPGEGGGPVLDSAGRVVAIVAALQDGETMVAPAASFRGALTPYLE